MEFACSVEIRWPETTFYMPLVRQATSDKRHADRLKAVYLLDGGWTSKVVAGAFLIDGGIVCNYFKAIRMRFCIGVAQAGSWIFSEMPKFKGQVRLLLAELKLRFYC